MDCCGSDGVHFGSYVISVIIVDPSHDQKWVDNIENKLLLLLCYILLQ